MPIKQPLLLADWFTVHIEFSENTQLHHQVRNEAAYVNLTRSDFC